MQRSIKFSFSTHGLGDVVHACQALRLYVDRGYDVQIQIEENKRFVWEAAGIPIYDGPDTLPLHPYYYPSDFFNLSHPDHTHSKIAHFFEIAELPKLGSKEDVWRMVCESRIDATAAVSPEAMAQARKLIDGLPKPIVLLHSKGSNWQAEKSIPDATTFALILELIDAIDGSIITLDWDSRSPTLHHDRVRAAGRIPLDVFSALCVLSDMLIGIDSGPFHLAQWLPISTLYVSRKIPPVRCCLPSPNATYLVPAKDHDHWMARSSHWRFLEYQGDEATVQDIMAAAFDIELFHERKAREMGTPTTASIIGSYTYRRCGHDERPMELRSDGTIGDGAAGCERTWKLTPTPTGEALVIYGDGDRDTCHLKICSDGVWRGRWLRHERMPIELIPVKPSKAGVALPSVVDLFDGRLAVYQPDEAARLFSSYDPAWGHPVGTRGNGMVWLLDSSLAHSDIDLHDHEDWIFKHLSVPTGGVYVDVGGYVGSTAIHIAFECKATVIVVEPVPAHQEMIRRNAKLNRIELKLVSCAAGDVAGTIEMDHVATCSHPTFESIQVAVRTLDDICRDLHRIDVIKVDTEGAECDVIAGAKETIRRLKPKLIIEVHGHMPGRENNGNILEDLFRELHYQSRRIWENSDSYYYIEAIPSV